MRSRVGRWISCVLIWSMLLTVGCGAGKGAETTGNGTEGQAGGNAQTESDLEEGWQYVPKEVELNAEGSYYSMKQIGDDLYNPVVYWDDENGSKFRIARYSVLTGKEEELSTAFSGSVMQFDIVEDGSIYALVMGFEADGADGGDYQRLEKYDAAGEMVYQTGITDLLSRENAGYTCNVIADSEGRAYLICEKKVLIFDGKGELSGSIESDDIVANGAFESAGRDQKGDLYVGVRDQNYKVSLAKLDPGKRTLEMVFEELPKGNGNSIQPAADQDFLVHDQTGVYTCNLEGQTKKKLFDWADSGQQGNLATSVGMTSDGRILAILNDWSSNKGSVLLFDKAEPGQVQEKITLVLGTVSAVTSLNNAVAEFNKTSDQYKIKVKTYMDSDEWSPEAMQEAREKIAMDIISGNGPDIVELSWGGMEEYAAQGMLEDLTPYLENSATLSRDDFVDHVLESNYCDGKLVGLMYLFTISGYAGRISEVGPNMGWTLDEFLAFADKYPNTQFFDHPSRSTALYFCLKYNMDLFVDPQTGKCSFDSPEFIRLLEFAKRFPAEFDSENTFSSVATKIHERDVQLAEVSLEDSKSIQKINAFFEGEPCVVGYPTIDGSVGCMLVMNQGCGISAKSKYKEGAWEFLETYVSMEYSSPTYGYPALKKQLEKMMEENRAKYAQDENGELLLDEDGNPFFANPVGTVTYGDGWSYSFGPTTPEEEELLMEIIRTAKPESNGWGKINEIIDEEAAYYFDGSKKIEDVIDIIQRRVQMYVSENS